MDKARTLTFVEITLRCNGKWEEKNIILVPSWTYQDSKHILQHPKVPKNVMDFNNQAQRLTKPHYLDVDTSYDIFYGVF